MKSLIWTARNIAIAGAGLVLFAPLILVLFITRAGEKAFAALEAHVIYGGDKRAMDYDRWKNS